MSKIWITLGTTALLFAFATAEGHQAQPDGAAIKATAVRLLQKTNAGRLGQLQAILREQSLAFEIQSVPNESRQSDARTEGHNILLSSAAQSGPAILVGAHFDAAALPDGQLSGGMVDNAASVAVLVHLATALKSQPLRHPVRIVFFDLEEEGLVGSRHFVKSMQKDSVAGMINLDTLQGGDTLFYGPAGRRRARQAEPHDARGLCRGRFRVRRVGGVPAERRHQLSPRRRAEHFTRGPARQRCASALADVERRRARRNRARLRAGSPADDSHAGGPAGEARSQGSGDCVQRRRGSAAPADEDQS